MQTIHLAYDSREQTPLHYYGTDPATRHGSTAVVWHRAALETFDYCVWRDWFDIGKPEIVAPFFAIERKSVADFIGTWFNKGNKAREIDKCERAEHWRPLAIVYVIEGGYEHIAQYNYARFPSGKVDAQAVFSTINKLRYAGVQVILAGNRRVAEYEIISLLKRRIASKGVRYWRELWAEENDGKKGGGK